MAPTVSDEIRDLCDRLLFEWEQDQISPIPEW
jgi:hypothetical protein